MNKPELNDNTTFDYIPSEINFNKSTNFRYNPNTFAFKTRNPQIIDGSGVDDYVYNEIKKAKYQGCFDPGSLGNKNIFMDNQNNRNKVLFSEPNSNNNLNKKTFEKNLRYHKNKTTSHIHKYDDGKVTECIGLGYKVYNYDRESFDKGVEFGPLFTKERVSKY